MTTAAHERAARDERARSAFLLYRTTGQPAAMAEVFDLCAQELLLIAHHLARQGVSAEDVLQSTFLQAITLARRYDESRPLMPWLCGILVNVARAARRRAGTAAHDSASEDMVDEHSVDPAEAAFAKEFVASVATAIAAFPVEQREALTLRLIHGLSVGQIARATGRPVGTVKSWLRRGVERLRQVLPVAFVLALDSVVRAEGTTDAVRAEVLAAANRTAAVAAPVRLPRTARWVAGGLALVAGLVVVLQTSTTRDADTPPLRVVSGRDDLALAQATRDDAFDLLAGSRTALPAAAEDAAVRVRVRYERDSSAAEGAVVRAEPRFGVEPVLRTRWAVTDANGEARFDGLPAGRYEVCVDRGEPRETELAPHGEPLVLAIASGVRVQGVVRDSEGHPIADASIWLSTANELGRGECVARTDSRGAYVLLDAPCERAIAAIADGFAPARLQAVADPALAQLDSSARIDFTLERSEREVSGVVVDAAGQAVPGAWVEVGPTLPATSVRLFSAYSRCTPSVFTVADAQGRFRCACVSPMARVSVWARGPGFEAKQVWAAAPFDELTIQLDGERTWRGRVDAPQVTSDSVWVRAEVLGRADSSWLEPRPRWCTPLAFVDSSGAFELPGLFPGLNRLIAGDANRHVATLVVDATLQLEHEWSPRLTDRRYSSGRVVDVDGRPLQGYRVGAIAVDGGVSSARVDAFGVYSAEISAAELECVVVYGPRRSYAGPLTHRMLAARDSYEVDFVLDARQIPSAYLVCERFDGDALDPRPEVVVVSESDETKTPAIRDERGALRIGPLPPGEYSLGVLGDRGWKALHGPFELAAGQELNCGALALEAPGGIEVLVVDAPPGRALHIGLVSARGGIMLGIAPVENGVACFDHVPRGRFLCTLLDPVVGLAQVAVDVVPNTTSEAVLRGSGGTTVRIEVANEQFQRADRMRWIWRRADGSEFVRTPIIANGVTNSLFVDNWPLPPGRFELEVRCYDGSRAVGVVEAPTAGGAAVLKLEMRR